MKQGKTCRWKGCSNGPLKGSHFCEVHVQVPTGSDLPKWVRDLPFAVGTGMAARVSLHNPVGKSRPELIE